MARNSRKNPSFPPELRPFMVRAEAARQAIRQGADPHFALSLVVWPTDKVKEAELRRAA